MKSGLQCYNESVATCGPSVTCGERIEQIESSFLTLASVSYELECLE